MKFYKIIAFNFIVFLSACHLQSADDHLKKVTLITPTGLEISTEIALSDQQQIKGLSGRKPESFCQDCAMLFYYSKDSTKNFWMIDTYMNLDIFFLDQNLKILAVERNMPAHPGKEEPPSIARTLPIFSRHVLEMRSDSSSSKSLEVGMQLQWKNKGDEKSILLN